jgi:hypothetical protein
MALATGRLSSHTRMPCVTHVEEIFDEPRPQPEVPNLLAHITEVYRRLVALSVQSYDAFRLIWWLRTRDPQRAYRIVLPEVLRCSDAELPGELRAALAEAVARESSTISALIRDMIRERAQQPLAPDQVVAS